MQKTSLVIMAAGIGSRFGQGIKQLAEVGPSGEIIMDYSIHALYTAADLPDYRSYSPANCKMCQNNEPIDAICNGFGYSRL